MRVLLGIAIVIGATALGAVTPFAFRNSIEEPIAAVLVCNTIGTAVKLANLTPNKRSALFEAVSAAPDVAAKSKAIVARAKASCI